MDDKERDEFVRTAKPVGLEVQEHGIMLACIPRRFSTGSVGWYMSGRLIIHGQSVQVSINMAVVGSKPGWVSSSKKPEQNGTMPLNEPETPPALFDEPKVPNPSSKHRKRS